MVFSDCLPSSIIMIECINRCSILVYILDKISKPKKGITCVILRIFSPTGLTEADGLSPLHNYRHHHSLEWCLCGCFFCFAWAFVYQLQSLCDFKDHNGIVKSQNIIVLKQIPIPGLQSYRLSQHCSKQKFMALFVKFKLWIVVRQTGESLFPLFHSQR